MPTSYLVRYFGSLGLVIFFIFWLVVFRPQRQQEDRHRKFVDGLKAGDKVVTTGGLHGIVHQVGEQTVRLKIAENVKVEISRAAIASAQPETKGN